MKKLFVLACALLCGAHALNAMDFEKGEKEPLINQPTIQETVVTLDNNKESNTNNDTKKIKISDSGAKALFERIEQEVEKCSHSPANKKTVCKKLQEVLAIQNITTRNQVISALELLLKKKIKRFFDIKISPEERANYTKKIKGIISRNTTISGLQLVWFALGMTGVLITNFNHEFTWRTIGMGTIAVTLVIGGIVSSMLARINSLELTNYKDGEHKLCCGTYLTEQDVFSKTDANHRKTQYNETLTRFYSMVQNIRLMPFINKRIQKLKKKNPKALHNIHIPKATKLIKKDQKEIYNLLLQLDAITKKTK